MTYHINMYVNKKTGETKRGFGFVTRESADLLTGPQFENSPWFVYRTVVRMK